MAALQVGDLVFRSFGEEYWFQLLVDGKVERTSTSFSTNQPSGVHHLWNAISFLLSTSSFGTRMQSGAEEVASVASVFDVAKYILEKTGPVTTMKLQKLVYYAQAWSTVWDDPPDTPLFPEEIQAWSQGPVVPDLFAWHKGRFTVDAPSLTRGDSAKLSLAQKATIDAVVDFYGPKTAQWLSDLTHSEKPWLEARAGIPDGSPGGRAISLETMHQYYGSLQNKA